MICTWAFNIAFKNWYPSLTSYSQKKLCSNLLSIQRVTFTWATEKRNLYSKVCRYTRLLLCATFVFPSGTWILWYFKKAVKYLVIVFCINRTGFLWSLLSIKRVPQLCRTRHSFWDTSASHTCKSLLVVSPGLQRRRADRLNLLGRLALLYSPQGWRVRM